MTKIRIKMNDGTEFIEELSVYNPVRLTEELNGTKNFINIGRLIVQRFSVVHVAPVKEDEPEETEEVEG